MKSEYRRGNYENDIMAILFFAAKALSDRWQKDVKSRRWITINQLAQPQPFGTGIPRATINYIFWFESQGFVVKSYTDEQGIEHSQVKESVMDRIAAKYGVRYKIRQVHITKMGRGAISPWRPNEACDCGSPTHDWEISATFVDQPTDRDWIDYRDGVIKEAASPIV